MNSETEIINAILGLTETMNKLLDRVIKIENELERITKYVESIDITLFQGSL